MIQALLGLLLLLASAAGGFTLATEAGARWLVPRLLADVPGLSVQSVSGRLLGGIELEEVRLEHYEVSARAHRITVRWQPSALLRGVVLLREVAVSGLEVRKHDTPPPERLPDLRPALRVAVDHLRTDGFRLAFGGNEPIVFERGEATRVELAGVLTVGTLALQTPDLAVELSGQLQPFGDYGIDASGPWRWEPPGRAPLAGDLRLGGRIRDLHLALGVRGWLDADVVARLGDLLSEVDLDLAAEVEGLELAALDPELPPVVLSGRLELTGRPATPEVCALASLAAPRLGGGSGAARLVLGGTLGDTRDLRWSLDAPDLAKALPGATGSLASQGRLRGTGARPDVEAQVRARDLAWSGYAAHSLEARVEGGLTESQSLHLEARGEGLSWPGGVVDRLRVEGSGRTDGHRITAEASGPEGRLLAVLQGALRDGPGWRGTLESGEVQGDGWGEWRLERPAALETGPGRVHLAALCWREKRAGRLCGELEREPAKGWSGRVEGSELALTAVRPWLPEGLDLQGSARVRAQGSLSEKGAATGEALLTLAPGKIGFRAGGQARQLPYAEASLQARLEGKVLTLRFDLPLPEVGSARGQATLTGWQPSRPLAPSTPLQGTASVSLRRLDLLETLFRELEDLRGEVAADFTLGGTLGRPRVRGQAEVRQGSLEVPRLGVRLTGLTLNLQSPEPGVLADEARALSGDRPLTVTGRTALDLAQGWPTTLRLRGEDVPAVNVPEARVRLSPDLSVEVRGRRVTLGGTVRVASAELRPRGLPQGADAASADVVVVRRGAPAPRVSPWQVTADVALALGQRVVIDGFGVKGRLEGNLRLQAAPGRLLLAQGEVSLVEGVYRAHGQDLKVERGRALYANSPLDDPGLDVKAIREVPDGHVGVRLTGTLKSPDASLFSDPALSQADAFAYLLLGRRSRQIDDRTQQSMAAAAAAMGLSEQVGLTGTLRSTLGIDSVGMETTERRTAPGVTAEETAVAIGRYLSPALYVRYLVGLFDARDVVQVRYDINRHVQIQSETGARTGADLFFTIER